MKRLRVATGLHLEAAQIQWMEQSKDESIRDRMFLMVLQKGIPFWGPGFACPRSNPFDSKELILGNAGTNLQDAPSGRCDWLKVVPGKTEGTVRVLPGVAYETYGERITVPEISKEVSVPTAPGTYNVILKYATKTSEESDWWPGTPNDPNDIYYKEVDYYDLVVTPNPPSEREIKLAEVVVAEDGTFQIVDKRDEALMKLRFKKVPFHKHYKADVTDFEHTHPISMEKYSYIFQPIWDVGFSAKSVYYYVWQSGQTSFEFYFWGTRWFKGAKMWAQWGADFDPSASFPYTVQFTLQLFPPGAADPIDTVIDTVAFQSADDQPESDTEINPYTAASYEEGWWKIKVLGPAFSQYLLNCWASKISFAVRRSYADSPNIYDEDENPIL